MSNTPIRVLITVNPESTPLLFKELAKIKKYSRSTLIRTYAEIGFVMRLTGSASQSFAVETAVMPEEKQPTISLHKSDEDTLGNLMDSLSNSALVV